MNGLQLALSILGVSDDELEDIENAVRDEIEYENLEKPCLPY